MDKKDMLRILRLLSAMETVMVCKETLPDYLLNECADICELLEAKILATDLTSSAD